MTERLYPDISDILARKEEARRELAARSWGEKILTVERMRERMEPFRRAREERAAREAVARSQG